MERTERMQPMDQALPYLQVLAGPDRGKVFPLVRRSMVIGRARDSDVVLGDARVSRRHARLRQSGDRFVVEDLGSANGTTCLGEQRHRQRRIGPNDRLYLGRTVLQLRTPLAVDLPTEPFDRFESTVAEPSRMERLIAVAIGTASALWLSVPVLAIAHACAS